MRRNLNLQGMSQIDLQQGGQGCRSSDQTHSCLWDGYGERTTRGKVTHGAGADSLSVAVIKTLSMLSSMIGITIKLLLCLLFHVPQVGPCSSNIGWEEERQRLIRLTI